MSTKKKTTPKPAPFVKPETKKPRTLKEISSDIKASIHRAHEAFAEALSDVKALAELAAQPKPAATPVKEKAPSVKEKGASVKPKAPAVKEKAPAAKPQPPVADPVPPSVKRRTPASVRLTPHEITLNFGSQPVRELAENDAKDFLNNPKIFWYRNTLFPDPRRYGVQPRVEQARVVKRTAPQFVRAPWTVSVTIHVDGDDKRAESWGVGVYGKNKGDQE